MFDSTGPGTLSTKKPINIVTFTKDNVPAPKIDRKKFVRFLVTNYHHLQLLFAECSSEKESVITVRVGIYKTFNE
jgi:hypothetical protein